MASMVRKSKRTKLFKNAPVLIQSIFVFSPKENQAGFTSGETEPHSFLLRLFCFLGDPLRGGRLPLAFHPQGLALCSLILFLYVSI